MNALIARSISEKPAPAAQSENTGACCAPFVGIVAVTYSAGGSSCGWCGQPELPLLPTSGLPILHSMDDTREIAAELPALVPQRHGGAVYAAGVPGHRGGPGRPPSALRERLRGSFEERIAVLEEIADDDEADPQDRIRAIDTLAKYGIGALREVSVEHVRDRLRETLQVLCEELPSKQAAYLINRLREIWSA
jgi:hypothetical protein